jgi:3-isopropylmalate/(R)-2-methylmalate dehydratase large subunit
MKKLNINTNHVCSFKVKNIYLFHIVTVRRIEVIRGIPVQSAHQPRNCIEKIWESHVIGRQLGHPDVFAIDFMLIHEVTSAQAFSMLEERGLPVWNTSRFLATLDHSIPTRKNRFEIFDDAARLQVEQLRTNTKRHGIPLHDFDSGSQGIVHVIGPELGITQPGMTIVCGDSHTSTHGAFGALAFGIGTSEVGHVLASGCLLLSRPKTMRVVFDGSFKPNVSAKDTILKLIETIGIGGANGHIIEYTGAAIKRLSMEERMTICNMSIECGARAGLIAPDQITYDYIAERAYAPRGPRWDEAILYWNSLTSDPDASYDRTVVIDLNSLEPMITWGTNPGQACAVKSTIPLVEALMIDEQESARSALKYVRLESGQSLFKVPVDWAFVGSCTNGRIEDLRIVANILKDRRVSKNVQFFIVPGSEHVRAQAIQEGLDRIFQEAGADFRLPGCSMCLGMNDDKVPAGKRCISSSNRNFVGRQGPGSITHLASPATVAASAVAGFICTQEDIRE